MAVLLRPGKTPSGAEVRTLLKHLVRRIRRHWPRTRLTFRGDSHYGRTEAMAWCEDNGVDYIFGLAGNPVLHRLSYEVADDLRVRRAEAGADRMRCFAAFDYAAGSWNRERRVVARLEATARGFDARYIVTSLGGDARHLYEDMTPGMPDLRPVGPELGLPGLGHVRPAHGRGRGRPRRMAVPAPFGSRCYGARDRARLSTARRRNAKSARRYSPTRSIRPPPVANFHSIP